MSPLPQASRVGIVWFNAVCLPSMKEFALPSVFVQSSRRLPVGPAHAFA